MKTLLRNGFRDNFVVSKVRKYLLKGKTTALKSWIRTIWLQKKYKISSTPTIYINDKKYEGKHDFKSFRKKLEKVM